MMWKHTDEEERLREYGPYTPNKEEKKIGFLVFLFITPFC